ncbi:low affinity immunoglobulin gamma Fc region receptor II-b-like isoform X2 [Brachyistius frenatus]|uniref:low affinity immunoglobulin gamma Fc region receptor II-b-like isoform X2 n=1 Tax=Brachyistius frenatus TaxID=100188 RepID=UPI0037E71487
MEVRALCIRLGEHHSLRFLLLLSKLDMFHYKSSSSSNPLISLFVFPVMFVFVAHVQYSNAALRIVPDRLQLFQYESVSFHCEGLNGSGQSSGIRNAAGFISVCNDTRTAAASCTIRRAYVGDSGEYWCETEGGQRSGAVTITVTAGSVVLQSPVSPVKEGDCVILRCRTKTTTSSLFPADFYKDGVPVGSGSAGEMSVHRVSTADEGLYKCSFSNSGESAESRLAVRETGVLAGESRRLHLVFRSVSVVVMVALLLLLLGLLHWRKLQLTRK